MVGDGIRQDKQDLQDKLLREGLWPKCSLGGIGPKVTEIGMIFDLNSGPI